MVKNEKIFTICLFFNVLSSNPKDAANGIDLSSNKKCATVSFIKSPTSFWVRLDEFKSEYVGMVKDLQAAYENANEEYFSIIYLSSFLSI